MKHHLVFALFFFSLQANGFTQTIRDFNLVGTWKINETTFETWEEAGDSLLGYQYEVNYGAKEIKEYLTITQQNNQWVYIAKVLDQNNGKPIRFTHNTAISNRFQFENFEHDFPKTISYQPVNDTNFLVSVEGANNEGFQLSLEKVEEPKGIPIWYVKHLQQEIGLWVADNSAHFNDNEPYISYGIEWKKGVDNTSITGELFGINALGNRELFWQLRQYWDNEQEVAVFNQFGRGGMQGKGTLERVDKNRFEVIQQFSIPNGYSWKEKHENTISSNQLISTSFDITEDGNWNKKRTMIWEKQ